MSDNYKPITLNGVDYHTTMALAVPIVLAQVKHGWDVLNEGRLFPMTDGEALDAESLVGVANELAFIHNTILDESGMEGRPLPERRMPDLKLVRSEVERDIREEVDDD